jgi:hypothetical protein
VQRPTRTLHREVTSTAPLHTPSLALGAVAASFAASHHLYGWLVPVRLGERDPVQGCVEMGVPGSGSPVSGLVGGPDRHRRGGVVTGVGVPGSEPIDPGGLTEVLAAVMAPQPGIAINDGAMLDTSVVISVVSSVICWVSARHRTAGRGQAARPFRQMG